MTLNPASLSRALPHSCRQPRRCPIGRAQQGVGGKACSCSFPDIVPATYRGMEGGGLWRCWRRRYRPDAASAPSRVAMAAPPGGGAAAQTDGPRTPSPGTRMQREQPPPARLHDGRLTARLPVALSLWIHVTRCDLQRAAESTSNRKDIVPAVRAAVKGSLQGCVQAGEGTCWEGPKQH